jgi:hypothetical protein
LEQKIKDKVKQMLLSDDPEMASLAETLFEAANPQIEDYDEIVDFLINPDTYLRWATLAVVFTNMREKSSKPKDPWNLK